MTADSRRISGVGRRHQYDLTPSHHHSLTPSHPHQRGSTGVLRSTERGQQDRAALQTHSSPLASDTHCHQRRSHTNNSPLEEREGEIIVRNLSSKSWYNYIMYNTPDKLRTLWLTVPSTIIFADSSPHTQKKTQTQIDTHVLD